MRGRDALETWIDVRPATALVAVGDVALVVLLVAGGLFAHAIDPIGELRYTLRTALPFVIGWAIAGPLLGAYSRLAVERPRRALVIVVAAWTAAALLGSAIRASPWFPGDAPPVFVAVTVGTGLLVFVPWRLVVWYIRLQRGL